MLPYFIDVHGNVWRQEPGVNCVNWYYHPMDFIPPLPFPNSNFQNENFKMLAETREDQLVKVQNMQPRIKQLEQSPQIEPELLIQKTKHQKPIKTDINNPINTKNDTNRFLTKNIEFNLLNQLFSFIWNKGKSLKIVEKYNRFNTEKVSLFYQYLYVLKKSTRKLISMKVLLNICNFNETHCGYKSIAKIKQSKDILTIPQFSATIRFIINYYLKQICPLTILTSKKMRKNIKLKHLFRARQIQAEFFEKQEENIPEQQINIDTDDKDVKIQ